MEKICKTFPSDYWINSCFWTRQVAAYWHHHSLSSSSLTLPSLHFLRSLPALLLSLYPHRFLPSPPSLPHPSYPPLFPHLSSLRHCLTLFFFPSSVCGCVLRVCSCCWLHSCCIYTRLLLLNPEAALVRVLRIHTRLITSQKKTLFVAQAHLIWLYAKTDGKDFERKLKGCGVKCSAKLTL